MTAGNRWIDIVVDEDDFRLACHVVKNWHATSDGSDAELIDRISAALADERSKHAPASHKHRWELSWEHMHGSFVIAEEHRCKECPSVRRSKVQGQDCAECRSYGNPA